MKIRNAIAGAFLVAGVSVLLPAPALVHAELIEQRIGLEPIRLSFGPGTTRLDGMGLDISAPDENNEINLLDYGDNPAGLLSDRDAWSIDFRSSHREYVERDARLSGFDYKANTYSLLAAYRKTSHQAFAGGFDLVESSTRLRGTPRIDFENIRYRFLYNRLFGKASFGFEFRFENEIEDQINPQSIYFIEHDARSMVGVAGVAYPIHEFVTVAARGDIRRTQIDGVAKSDAFRDEFDWDRPSGSAAAQVFVNHPRVTGGASLGRTEGAGRERVRVAWSPLFVFNPSIRFVRFERETLTEKMSSDRFSTRWQFEAVPGFLSLTGALTTVSGSQQVTSVQTVAGSRLSSSTETDDSDFGLGGNLLLANERLFLGGEFHSVSAKLVDLDPLDGFTLERTVSTVSVGGEYLFHENFAVRNGWGVRTEDRSGASDSPGFDPGVTGSYSATMASFGLGFVPRGGALQLDAAFSTDLSSDLDISQRGFSLSARLLF